MPGAPAHPSSPGAPVTGVVGAPVTGVVGRPGRPHPGARRQPRRTGDARSAAGKVPAGAITVEA